MVMMAAAPITLAAARVLLAMIMAASATLMVMLMELADHDALTIDILVDLHGILILGQLMITAAEREIIREPALADRLALDHDRFLLLKKRYPWHTIPPRCSP